jgi:hypothetical protein
MIGGCGIMIVAVQGYRECRHFLFAPAFHNRIRLRTNVRLLLQTAMSAPVALDSSRVGGGLLFCLLAATSHHTSLQEAANA